MSRLIRKLLKKQNDNVDIEKKERDQVLDAVAAIAAIFAASVFTSNLVEQLHADEKFPFSFIENASSYSKLSNTYSFLLIFVSLLLFMLFLISLAKKNRLKILLWIMISVVLCSVIFVYMMSR